MNVEPIEQPNVTPDAFDAAVSVESTYVEPAAEPETSEPAKPAAPTEDKPPIAAKPAEKKPWKDAQNRIDQAVARQREAERRADEALRRAEDAERRVAAARLADEAPRAASTPQADEFPTYAQYLETKPEATLEQYMQAHYRWNRDKEIQAERAERETAQLEQGFSQRASTFSESYAKAVEADADLPSRIDPQLLSVRPYSNLTSADKALIRSIPDAQERDAVAFRCFLADQWIDSEHSVALLEHLSDPGVFQRLAALQPKQVIRELARFEAGLTPAIRKDISGSGREAKPASQARAPIKPLGTTSPLTADDDGSDDEPVEKFIHRENTKLRKAGRF